MSEMSELINSYRQFFDRFIKSVNPNDQLPVKVAGYNLLEHEIPGAVGDWALQYLEQRQCPPTLIAHLVYSVVEEVKNLCRKDPVSCGYRSELEDYASLRLMQVCVSQLAEVCARYSDNAKLLSLLPSSSSLPPLVSTLAIKNSRRSMEDRHVIIHDFHTMFNIQDQGPASYYGVFDGHNGPDAAIYSVAHLHQYLAESTYYPTDPIKALREACIRTDNSFTIKALKENLHGGTTAVMALLRPKERMLYVAWLGDSQAVLVRRGRATQLVMPHKPDRPDERMRIETMGGAVVFWGAWRVNGQLAVSRAIGDIEYKPYVTADPDVEELCLDGTEDFLILACDGLWDFVSEVQATRAVYKQLQKDPGDLETVSHELVKLAREQSSQDNISVVVVFLASAEEILRRRAMETERPARPLVKQNGSADSLFRNGVDDDEDFGPETDVDMVDDVLLSPTIAASKRKQELTAQILDDLLQSARDTPTPSAKEVVDYANVSPLGDSGGEESEEEWNYIPGKESKSDQQDQEDMSSQLNPNAAEFVPVSPTKIIMMDDAIISASPQRGHETSIDDIQMPSETEFSEEISHRPSDLGTANGLKPKQVDDYFMRDNFSTLRNKSPDMNSTSTCAQMGDDSTVSFPSSVNSPVTFTANQVPFDKFNSVQNIADSNDFLFGGSENSLSNNAVGGIHEFAKNPMTSSLKDADFTQSGSVENLIPGSPKSTDAEAPQSPCAEDVLHTDDQADLEPSSLEDFTSVKHEESRTYDTDSEPVESPVDENEGFITEHRRSPPIDLSFKPLETFSDANPFGTLEIPSTATPVDQNNILSHFNAETPVKMNEHQECDDYSMSVTNTPSSFILAREKTPLANTPVPFEELASPTEIPDFVHPPNANSSVLASELPKSPEHKVSLESLNDHEEKRFGNESTNHNSLDNLPVASPIYEETSFTTELETREELKHYGSDLNTTEEFLEEEANILKEYENEFEQPKLTEKIYEELPEELECSSEVKPEPIVFTEPDNEKVHQVEVKDFDSESDTKEMHLEFESHIPSQERITEVCEFESHIPIQERMAEDLGDLDDGFEVISKDDLPSDEEVIVSDLPNEVVEINVSGLTPEEFINSFSQNTENESSPVKETTNPFSPDIFANTSFEESFNMAEDNNETDININSNVMNVLEDVGKVEKNRSDSEEVLASPLEPEVVKSESYQLLTPADEPLCTKTEVSLTEKEEEKLVDAESKDIPDVKEEEPTEVVQTQENKEESIESEIIEEKSQSIIEEESITGPDAEVSEQLTAQDEPEIVKSEPVKSQVVTETLITALEEISEVPPLATTEDVHSEAAGTPPPTPTPVPESDTKTDTEKAEILVAAVAAAGAVAAGAALATDKAKKEVPSKKLVAAPKKPSDTASKAPSKPLTAKAPAKPLSAKPATTKPANPPTKPTTASTKPAATATKLTGAPSKTTASSGSVKATTTRPSSAPVSGKSSSATTKPTAPKSSLSSTAKTAPTGAPKPVPKNLPLSKPNVTLKPTSKTSTPTSKPTTPTTPSVMKIEVKSPGRAMPKASLTARSSAAVKTEDSAEKKSLINGEAKPPTKKLVDVPAKRPATSTTAKSSPTTPRPPAAVAKALPTKPPSAATKPLASKPQAAAPLTKPKSAPSAAAKPTAPVPVKRPSTSTSVKSTADKSVKEATNKQLSNSKPVNGKTLPSKNVSAPKKSDAKVNGKSDKVPVSKKLEEAATENDEHIVATTNGFGGHDDHADETVSSTITEISPVY